MFLYASSWLPIPQSPCASVTNALLTRSYYDSSRLLVLQANSLLGLLNLFRPSTPQLKAPAFVRVDDRWSLILIRINLSSVEARQSSEGSVGSVNMAVHHHHHLQGVANGFSPDPSFMFSVGQGFEKSEEGSGNSVAAKNVVGGKIVSGSEGKIWRDTIKNASQKPCSSMDSDLRSSDFVFSSGAVSAANNHGGNDERKELQIYSRSENGEQDEDGDGECKEENHYWADKDQIADSIRNLAALHDALWKGLAHKP